MRTYRAYSLISRIIPSVYMTLSGVLLIGIVVVCLSVRSNHTSGIKNINLKGILMFALGVIITCIAGAASRDADKYTLNTVKTTAVITDVVEKVPAEGSSTYMYEMEFSYKDEVVSVKMFPTHRVKLESGDTIDVYFYPDEIGHTDYPIVVAVDYEKNLAADNMKVGFLACVIGVSLMILAVCKQRLLSNGFHTSATVTRVAVTSSKEDNQSSIVDKTLTCQGRNPVTGMRQTFCTHGGRFDFLSYNDGDTVHVFIHKRCSSFYVINI